MDILYLGDGEIQLKLNKHKATLSFLQPKFLVENQYCPVKYILYAGLGKMGLIKLAFTA